MDIWCENSVFQPLLRLRGGGADKKRKEARKRNFANLHVDEATDSTEEAEPSARKRRKQDLPDPEYKEAVPFSEKNSAGDEPVIKNVDTENGDMAQCKSQRFIVFIGNLPYTTTDVSLRAHFAKVQPTSIRHRTDKETGKSKGFAFLEFEAYDRMKTCLKIYHHSKFDDGESPARKINVELTVGGGGAKSKGRKTKLQAKNWKLSEERKRRAQEEAQAEKMCMARKGAAEGQEKGQVVEKAEKNDSRLGTIDHGDIHPSRRSRVPAR